MKLDAGDGREDGDGAYKPVTVEFPQHEGASTPDRPPEALEKSSPVVPSTAPRHVHIARLGVDGPGRLRQPARRGIPGQRLNIRDHFSILKTPDAVPPAIVRARQPVPTRLRCCTPSRRCPIDARRTVERRASIERFFVKTQPAISATQHLAGRYGATPGLSAATKLAVAHSRQCRRRGRALRAVGSTHASLFSVHQARSPLSHFSSA